MHPTRTAVMAMAIYSAMLLAACGGGDDSPTSPPSDTTPSAFSFTDQTDVAQGSEITSAAVAIGGIDAAAPISVSGGSYAINAGAFTTAAGTIVNGNTVRLRHTAGATASTVTSTVLTIGGVTDTFTSTTAAVGVDATPDAFSFVDQPGVAPGTLVTSSAVTISGINAPAALSVSGGSHSIGCTTTFVTTATTIANGQTVCLRHTSAATPATAVNTVLTVGGVADTFTSTTAALVGADTTPDAFSFPAQSDVSPGATITSSSAVITGIEAPAAVTISGGQYSIGCTATFTATASTIDENQSVCVRHTASATASTAVNTTLTIGGVSAVFRSTTADAAVSVVGLLPLLTGGRDLRLLDPTMALDSGNPLTIDTNVAAPAVDSDCRDCFDRARGYFSGAQSGSEVSNLHMARLVYVERTAGNSSGGRVLKVNTTRGAPSNQPVQISTLADACRILNAKVTDFPNVDHSAAAIERSGSDGLCDDRDDNIVTVIRLDSSITDPGIDIPLAHETRTPLHAQTNTSGVVTGYVSFESSGGELRLVRRDANLANPVTLLTMADSTGANIEQTDRTHLFVTATPVDDGLNLFRVRANGTLSATLHRFAGFNAGNPLYGGLRDATNLYFADADRLLRLPIDATSETSSVIATLPTGLRVEGHRSLDLGSTPARLVFQAVDDGFTVASGVFSAAVDASDDPVTVLANYPDSEGGISTLLLASQGRAYINVSPHADTPITALKINSDGQTPGVSLSGAYWSGSLDAESFDAASASQPATQTVLLSRRTVVDGEASETLRVVPASTGVTGALLGSVANSANFQALRITGLGRFALVRAEIDREGTLDDDVYFFDSQTASSLAPAAVVAGSKDSVLR